MPEEFEIVESTSDKDNYSMIPVAPMKRLEARIEGLEKAGSVPQLQGLISQIIDLVRTNQKIIEEVIRANLDLRNELAKLPMKIDQMIDEIRDLIELIESAGREETSAPGPEVMKPIFDQIKNMEEQNKAMMEAIENLNKKIKAGTPVSKILSSYPNMKVRREF